MPSSCRDQGVVAGQRPNLHLGLSPSSPALPSELFERPLVGGVGEGQVAGEAAAWRAASSPLSSAIAVSSRWEIRTSTLRPARRGSSE
jgi:hypothetical protein